MNPSPVKAALPGTRTVLTWFSQYERPDGLLRKLPWWSFIDWMSSGELPTLQCARRITRSDSHAWSAHPIYDLLTMVAGIEPASPGFATVRIAPHLGDLRDLSADFPHLQGMIKVHFERNGDALTGTVTLPPGLQGVFLWRGKEQPLQGGVSQIAGN